MSLKLSQNERQIHVCKFISTESCSAVIGNQTFQWFSIGKSKKKYFADIGHTL